MEVYRFIGSPECERAIAQAIAYSAVAPKSNAMYTVYSQVRSDARIYGMLPVPMHIRNTPIQLLKELCYNR